ncbi:MAG TPA: aminoglycoside adenylyltransferase domain-containing protein [Roseiflexaceae bacterium]|nr:aminoglycoside adenylyltransferase domain-containing protein [Roseiflexaceae bacterium]
MQLPDTVSAIVSDFLAAADAEAPGLIEGLYLVGSVALEDFRPRRSDVDFVAVTASQIEPKAYAALERAHAGLSARWPRPFFDGIYVTWRDLAGDPASANTGPHAHEHRLQAEGRSERHPVTWRTLAQAGVCCRGPAVAELEIWNDTAALAAWTDNNLDAYWRRMLEPGSWLTRRGGLAGLTEYACEWCVLGVSRLHYTLATGKITSKRGAGPYAQSAFGARWQPVIAESLRIRRADSRRSLYWSPFARRRDVLRFLEMAIEASHRLYGSSPQSTTTNTS